MKWHIASAQGYVNIRTEKLGEVHRTRGYYVVFGDFARKYHFFLVPSPNPEYQFGYGAYFNVICRETGKPVGPGAKKRPAAMQAAAEWLEATGRKAFGEWVTDWGLAPGPRKPPAHKGYTRAAWRARGLRPMPPMPPPVNPAPATEAEALLPEEGTGGPTE